MRVISGSRRGQKLYFPVGRSRPTEDRIKENIFNIIQPVKQDAICLDLFACTGQVGIEFLSRGAKKAYFSEKNRKNLEILKMNIERTRFTEESVILDGDFRRNLMQIQDKLDYVFLDPPYKSGFIEEAMTLIAELDLLAEGGEIITETNRVVEIPEDLYERIFQRNYGSKDISIYVRKES